MIAHARIRRHPCPRARSPSARFCRFPTGSTSGSTTYDAKDPATSFPPIEPLRPPEGAPNVLVILIDDAGFGSSSAFGGPCQTPNFERLADNGLRYNRFHTTALCSPTRQALLTGRNHHAVGMGGITEIASSAPGYSSIRPKSAAPLAETLKLNGYSTAQFGKCHEVPVWETSPMGPFDAWPTGGGGFEHFYGFLGGETNQYAPALYEDTVPLRARPHTGRGVPLHRGHDGSHDRLDPPAEGSDAGQAVLRLLRTRRDARPAPRPPRSGLRSTRASSTRAGTRFARRRWRARRSSSVIPEDAELTERPAEIPAWDETPDDMKPIFARQMEVYAGFMEHTDHHTGRLIDALADLEILDGTLVYLIIGDNGASAEGTPNGCFNEITVLNGASALETVDFMTSRIDDFGTPKAYNHYAVGWAHAMDTPYQWTKQVASHWGGTRNGTIVHWPERSSRRVRCGRSSTTSSTSPPPCSTRPDCPSPRSFTASSRCPCTAPRWRRPSTTRRPLSGARPSTSRCSATAASTTRAGPPSRGTPHRG